jgi:hypothetical protein
LSFRTLSSVLVLKNKLRETRRFGNWLCFRPKVRGKKPILLGPLERASPNHWTRTMDRVRKLNISESYTPSSESYSKHCPCSVCLCCQHFKTLYSRRQNLDVLFLNNVFKNKIDCCSVVDSAGLRVHTKQIRDFSNFKVSNSS